MADIKYYSTLEDHCREKQIVIDMNATMMAITSFCEGFVSGYLEVIK